MNKLMLNILILVIVLVGKVSAQTSLPELCPSNFTSSAFVGAGCPCNPLTTVKVGLCARGFVCAEPWSENLLRSALGVAAPPSTELAAGRSVFICQPCTYGQYCPEGSVLPPATSPLIQMALARLNCPTGKYCPTPGEAYPCTSGSFCAQGSVRPVTCNMSVLVDSYPGLTMPTRPTTVYESVYIRGQQLAGNQCPANSSTPTNACAGGYYCPSPGETVICPAGYYCKQGSQTPSKCPALTNCPEGSDKATLSWTGFIMLAGVLSVLWISYLLMITILRMNQRKLGRTQTARERLWKLLNPLFASQNHSKSQAFRAFKAIRPKITIQFDNLGLTLRDGHAILSGVSGKFTHSRVAAIMGPSGAGKSTFLNVIMGKTAGMGKVTGGIRANGREMRPEALQAIVGFVPQEDIVHEDLTVRENLVYSARLRLSAAKPLKEQLAIVDDVINVLQLRHVQHNLVGSAERRGISGGQRKRVNIGMELVAKPSVLFMDEPTSGLDATAAADILGALKRMAGLGMNIITVIHQPRFSIFSLFDDVMLLCKGGKLAYLGPSRLALPYMESVGFVLPPNENPADFAMDVLSGSVPRTGFPSFQPEDLVPLWESHGSAWVKSEEASRAGGALSRGPEANPPAQEAVDPEQLRLLEEAFDNADGDEDEAIDGAGLKVMLQGLGLEPTASDISMIVAELGEPNTGLIRKSAFLQYVRYGGRPPTADAPGPGAGGNQRRIDSLYRVYSIEQYTLGNALAEMAASQLPAALKADPPASLKTMAAAAMESAGTSGSKESLNLKDGSSGGSSGTARKATLSQPSIPEVDEISDAASMRTGSITSVASLQLPDPLESETGSASRESSPPLSRMSPANIKDYPQYDSHRGSITDLPSAAAGDVPAQKSLKYRFLRLFGLEASSGRLRSTPGVFGQLYVLMVRAGVKWARNWNTRFTDLLLLIVAAVCCGAMHGTGSLATDVRGQSCLVLLTLGILSASTSLSVFGKDKLVFWRESASGVAVLPYFLANTAINLVDVALHPLVFLAIYTSMTLPAIDLAMYYLIGVLVVWWTSSAGCLVSVLVNNSANALVAAVAVVMISGGFINGVSPNYRDLGTATKRLTAISYNRWAVEGVVIATYQNYPEYQWPLSKALVNLAGYCGLDKAGVPAIAGSSKGNYVVASNAPAWDDPWQRPDAAIPKPTRDLEEQDIHIYCAGYLEHDLVVLFLEGLVLRLATLIALWVCPHGLSLEPLVVVLSSIWERIRRVFRRKVRRRTTTATGGGAV